MTTSRSPSTLPGLEAYIDVIRRADQYKLAHLVSELFTQLYENEDKRLSSVLDIMEAHGFSPETLEESCLHTFKVLISCANRLGTPKLVGVQVAARLDTPVKLAEEKVKQAVLDKGFKDLGHIYHERLGPTALFDHFYWVDALEVKITGEEERKWSQERDLAKLVEEAQAWGEYDGPSTK